MEYDHSIDPLIPPRPACTAPVSHGRRRPAMKLVVAALGAVAAGVTLASPLPLALQQVAALTAIALTVAMAVAWAHDAGLLDPGAGLVETRQATELEAADVECRDQLAAGMAGALAVLLDQPVDRVVVVGVTRAGAVESLSWGADLGHAGDAALLANRFAAAEQGRIAAQRRASA